MYMYARERSPWETALSPARSLCAAVVVLQIVSIHAYQDMMTETDKDCDNLYLMEHDLESCGDGCRRLEQRCEIVQFASARNHGESAALRRAPPSKQTIAQVKSARKPAYGDRYHNERASTARGIETILEGERRRVCVES